MAKHIMITQAKPHDSTSLVFTTQHILTSNSADADGSRD